MLKMQRAISCEAIHSWERDGKYLSKSPHFSTAFGGLKSGLSQCLIRSLSNRFSCRKPADLSVRTYYQSMLSRHQKRLSAEVHFIADSFVSTLNLFDSLDHGHTGLVLCYSHLLIKILILNLIISKALSILFWDRAPHPSWENYCSRNSLITSFPKMKVSIFSKIDSQDLLEYWNKSGVRIDEGIAVLQVRESS